MKSPTFFTTTLRSLLSVLIVLLLAPFAEAVDPPAAPTLNQVYATIPTTATNQANNTGLTTNFYLLYWTDNSSDEDFFEIDVRVPGTYDGWAAWQYIAKNETSALIRNLDFGSAVPQGAAVEWRVLACKGPTSPSITILASAASLSRNVPYDRLPESTWNAPTNFTAGMAPGSDFLLRFNWTDNSNKEEGYELHFKASTDLTYSGSPATSFNFGANPPDIGGGLQPGLTYNWKIRPYRATAWAVNSQNKLVATAYDYGPFSNESTFTVAALIPPAGLTAVAVNENTLKLTWSDNSANENKYLVEYRQPSGIGNFVEVGTVPGNTTTVNIPDLPALSTDWRVSAEYDYTLSGIGISQIYASGGDSGAVHRNDFVELYNRGESAVDLTNWSIQYAGPTGTTWEIAALSGTVQPGHYYLIKLGSGGATGATLPAEDRSNTAINLGSTGGKIALLNVTTVIAAGTSSPLGTTSGLVDYVGYGSANDFLGSAVAPTPSATLSVIRKGLGEINTEQNGADFQTGTPNPRNSSIVHLTRVLSTPSNTATLTLPFNAPTNLQASFTSASTASTQTVSLTWVDNSLVESGYRVLYRPTVPANGAFSILQNVTGTNQTSVNVSGPSTQFVPGVSYDFQVMALYTDGVKVTNSAASNTATAVARDRITSRLYQPITKGVPFSFTLSTSSPAASFSATGLPPNVQINPTTGEIHSDDTTAPGPSQAGLFSATVSATFPSGFTDTKLMVFRVLTPVGAPTRPVVLTTRTIGTSTTNTIPLSTGSADTSLFADPDSDTAVRLVTTKGTINMVLKLHAHTRYRSELPCLRKRGRLRR